MVESPQKNTAPAQAARASTGNRQDPLPGSMAWPPRAGGFSPCPWEGARVQAASHTGRFTCRQSNHRPGSAWGRCWRTQGLCTGALLTRVCVGRKGSICVHRPGLWGCWAHWVPQSLTSALPARGAEAGSPALYEERHGRTKPLGGLEETSAPLCAATGCQGGLSPLIFLARTPGRGLASWGQRQPSATPLVRSTVRVWFAEMEDFSHPEPEGLRRLRTDCPDPGKSFCH